MIILIKITCKKVKYPFQIIKYLYLCQIKTENYLKYIFIKTN